MKKNKFITNSKWLKNAPVVPLCSGPGPFPGVLDLFGSVGGTVEHRGALLASRGVAALSLCYFMADGGRGDPQPMRDLEYFEVSTFAMIRYGELFRTTKSLNNFSV